MVVSEPDNNDGECEDIGYAYVVLSEILKENKNLTDKELICNLF